MDFQTQLRFRAQFHSSIRKTLDACAQVANTVGQLADQGRMFSISDPAKLSVIAGAIQVGEWIHTGVIPSKELVMSVISVGDSA